MTSATTVHLVSICLANDVGTSPVANRADMRRIQLALGSSDDLGNWDSQDGANWIQR
jgi:hypothetical protein